MSEQLDLQTSRTFPSHDGRTLIKGKDLRVGDTIIPMGTPHLVVGLEPYTGTIPELQGAKIAWFASGLGMTVCDEMRIEIAGVTVTNGESDE